MLQKKRKYKVELVSSDATDDDDDYDSKRTKIVRVKKEKSEEHEGPTASISEIDEAFGDDGDTELAALLEAELAKPEEEDVPEVLDASDDEDRPLVHPKKVWLGKVLQEITKSKTLSEDRKADARAALARYKSESDAVAVYNAFVERCGETWCAILDRVGAPPGGWQPLPAAAAEVADESDEEPEVAPLCTHDRVQRILGSWRAYKAIPNFKTQRAAVREVKDTDTNLHRLEGRCAYEKLVAWVGAALHPHGQPRSSVEEYAKMLYLMLATNTKEYTNVAGLIKYLDRTPPERAMAHICLHVLNKSVDDERAVDRVVAFHLAVAKVAAGQRAAGLITGLCAN